MLHVHLLMTEADGFADGYFAPVLTMSEAAQNDQAPAPETTEPAKSAASGTGVITDPRTGNVLASANGAESGDTAKDTAGGKRVLIEQKVHR